MNKMNKDFYKIVIYLFDFGFDVNVRCKIGEIFLYCIVIILLDDVVWCMGFCLLILRFLVKNGVIINV